MTSAEILKQLSEKIGDLDSLLKVHEQLKQDAHILIPTTLNVRGGVVLYPTAIVINTNFATYTIGNNTYNKTDNEDIYKTPGGFNFAFKEKKLRDFKEALALQIFKDKILDRKTDDTSHRVTYILYSLDYCFRSANGSMISGTEIGKYDYWEELGQAEDMPDNNAKEKEKKEGALKRVNQRRRSADQLARTNCLVRIINKAVPGLAPSYTLNELRKPFIVAKAEIEIPKLILQEAPPEMQQELMYNYFNQIIGGVNTLYPETPIRTLESGEKPLLPEGNSPNKIEDANVVTPEKEPEDIIGQETEPMDCPPSPKGGELNPEQSMNRIISRRPSEKPIDPDRPPGMNDDDYVIFLAEQYKDQPAEVRITKIEELIKETKYTRMNSFPIEKYTLKRQMEFLTMLFKMKIAAKQ